MHLSPEIREKEEFEKARQKDAQVRDNGVLKFIS